MSKLDTKKVAEILDNAADVIETDGWTQDTMHDDRTDRYCTYGAIIKGSRGKRYTPWQMHAAVTSLSKELGDQSITSWNDRLPNGQQASNSIRKIAATLRRTARKVRG